MRGDEAHGAMLDELLVQGWISYGRREEEIPILWEEVRECLEDKPAVVAKPCRIIRNALGIESNGHEAKG